MTCSFCPPKLLLLLPRCIYFNVRALACQLLPNGATVGAVYDRTFFVESTKYARSQTAPTVRQLELSKIESHFELHPSSSPTLTPHKLTLARYAAATKLEDAMDIVERNPWQRDLEPAAIKRLGV